jgi:PilZ domain-containing protein
MRDSSDLPGGFLIGGVDWDMSIERRRKVRYPLELTVRYQTLDEEVVVSGVGRTLNMSSSGILIVAENTVKDGSRLKVTLEWPSLLNGITPLQLVTIGRVVRRGASSLAISVEQYQFRTMGRTAQLAVAVSAGSGEQSTDSTAPSLPGSSPAQSGLEEFPIQNAV